VELKLIPKQLEAFNYVRSGNFSCINYGGAMGGGKTIFGLITLLTLCKVYPGSRWVVVRQDMEKIRTTTIASLEWINAPGEIKRSPYEYIHPNGSVILFKAENYQRDKEHQWMKGLEVNGFLFEEVNETQESCFRLAFTRAGRWKIRGIHHQPKPLIMTTMNPSQGWVKDLIYDPWKNGTLRNDWIFIPSLPDDNPYISDIEKENYKNLTQYEYEVYVKGNWDIQLKTGGEFWKSFELDQHVRPTFVDTNKTIHVSVDNNVYPYIAISLWQIEKIGERWDIKQVHEICAKDPNNTATKAGRLAATWLTTIGYNQTVFQYGDPSTQNRNTIDDDKKTFLDKFMGEIKKHFQVNNKMLRSAPSVSVIGDFINAIYEENWGGMSITIGEHCKYSISDYIELKQDKDGGTLKKRITDPQTKVSYEPVGHLSDTKKDFIVSCFANEFAQFINRFVDQSTYIHQRRTSGIRGGI